MVHILAIKLQLPCISLVDVEGAIIDRLSEGLDKLGCVEMMFSTWSWGTFSIDEITTPEIHAEIESLRTNIVLLLKSLNIYQEQSVQA